MMTRKVEKAEYGDFQTPPNLAQAVCTLLAQTGLRPAGLLEPTCGVGNLLRSGLQRFESVRKAVGADINGEYVRRAQAAVQEAYDSDKIKLLKADFFLTDWHRVIHDLPEPILVLGNPPWVTNAGLGALGSQNLPRKSNFQNHRGLDAITGKANFDISEWMLIRLMEAMDGRLGALAMLCKSSVARKALKYAWERSIALQKSATYRIDADFHFDAAVDAVLLVTMFKPGSHDRNAPVYPHLRECEAQSVTGYEDGLLLADIAAYHRRKHLLGGEDTGKWRSGIKHDCAKVMELHREGGKFRNGFGEVQELEEPYLYPMLKSSSVANGGARGINRCMLVTQKRVGDDTTEIERKAPKTWAYLHAHADLLNKRASSIYRNRPPFSIFGIGDYTFAPWKVAISGFYKKLFFATIGPLHDKPVVLDDTSYFLPCQTKPQADYLASLLNSQVAQDFYKAFVFWDGKRPITAELLGHLNLRRLASELGSEELFQTHLEKDVRNGSSPRAPVQLELWNRKR